MTIFVVKKYEPNIIVRKELSLWEEQALIAYFIKRKKLSWLDEQAVLALCNEIHQRDVWLQCRCQDSDSKHPLMRFNLSRKKRFYIHNINSRGRHISTCPFEKQVLDGDEDGMRPTRKARTEIKRTGALDLMETRASGISKPAGSLTQKNQERTARRSTLCRALFRLLDDSKCNVIDPNSKQSPMKALVTTINQTDIVINKSLKDYFYFDARQIVSAAIALREDKSVWPRNLPRHALFLLNVVEIQDNTLIVLLPNGTLKPVTIRNRIDRLSGRFGTKTGPFMALVTLTDSMNPNFYEPFNAFVSPRYSDNTYMPVDSHYEREMLRRLYGLLHELRDTENAFTIEKPLFEIEIVINDEESYGVLPDFIVKAPNKTIVIEVDGSLEPEYKERKRRTQALMARLGTVMVFDAITFDKQPGQLNQELMAFTKRLRSALC